MAREFAKHLTEPYKVIAPGITAGADRLLHPAADVLAQPWFPSAH
jgi:hypothetical protein